MWVDYRGSLSTVYNDGEISTCGQFEGFTMLRNDVRVHLNLAGNHQDRYVLYTLFRLIAYSACTYVVGPKGS